MTADFLVALIDQLEGLAKAEHDNHEIAEAAAATIIELVERVREAEDAALKAERLLAEAEAAAEHAMRRLQGLLAMSFGTPPRFH